MSNLNEVVFGQVCYTYLISFCPLMVDDEFYRYVSFAIDITSRYYFRKLYRPSVLLFSS